jgi:hypothetical protein
MADELEQTHDGDLHRDAAWMEGYRAALNDALAMVDALGGPSFANLSAPVLLRLKTRLIEMQGHSRAA